MEQEKKNKGLITLVIILSLLVLCLGGYIIYDKVLSKEKTTENNKIYNHISNNSINENKNTNENIDNNTNTNESIVVDNSNNKKNIENNDKQQNQRVLNSDEQKGLELYKFFVGDGTGPFKWENNAVINYDEVMSKMTDSYKKSFENSDNGFSIPYNDNGVWKSFGGWGTDRECKFKDIKITLIDDCKIHYEITYTYTKMGDTTGEEYEDKNEFIAKMNSCYPGDKETDFSTGYKVDSFKLIYGLKFE